MPLLGERFGAAVLSAYGRLKPKAVRDWPAVVLANPIPLSRKWHSMIFGDIGAARSAANMRDGTVAVGLARKMLGKENERAILGECAAHQEHRCDN